MNTGSFIPITSSRVLFAKWLFIMFMFAGLGSFTVTLKAMPAGSDQTFLFTDSLKGNGNFRAATYDLIRIDISDGIATDQAVVYFINGGTEGFDPDYDAHKIANGGLSISTYSNTGTDTDDMAMNGISDAGNVYLPVKIQSRNFNECKMTVSQYINSKSRVLYVFDKLINSYDEIKESGVYNFGIIATSSAGRFYITSSNGNGIVTNLAEDFITVNRITISPNPYSEGSLKISIHNVGKGMESIEISDTKGQLIKSVPGNAYEFEIESFVADLLSGTYILRYTEENVLYQQKLIIIK